MKKYFEINNFIVRTDEVINMYFYEIPYISNESNTQNDETFCRQLTNYLGIEKPTLRMRATKTSGRPTN